MKLYDFYANILKSFNIKISDTGFLQYLSDGEYIDLTRRKGMAIALPTEENLKNLYVLDNNGKYTASFLIFNPLSEQAAEDGVSLDILKDCVRIAFMGALKVFGDLILVTYNNPKLQADLPMAINAFIKDAKDSTIPGMKSGGKAIDDTTIAKWDKLVNAYMTNYENPLFQLVIPRTKKAADKDSNTREARLTCPLWNDVREALETISNASDEEQKEKVEIQGVKLRYKDLKIFNDLLTVFMVGANEKGAIVAGTKDTEAPGFIALMLLFHNTMTVINGYLESMREADPVEADGAKCVIDFNAKDIETAPLVFKKDLLLIPNENEVNMGSSVVNAKKGTNLNINNLHPYVQSAVESTQSQQEEIAVVQQDVPKDGMAAILGNNRAGLNQLIHGAYQGIRVMQPTMQMYQPQVAQPVMADTTTSNSAAPKMVSRLSPQYNSQAAAQTLAAQNMQQMVQPQPMMMQQPIYGYSQSQMMQQQYMGQPMMMQQPMVASPYGNPYFR